MGDSSSTSPASDHAAIRLSIFFATDLSQPSHPLRERGRRATSTPYSLLAQRFKGGPGTALGYVHILKGGVFDAG